MTRVILILLFLYSAGAILPLNPDSLKTRLISAGGWEKVAMLNELSNSTRSDSVAASLRYALQACNLAIARKDGKGEVQACRNIGLAYLSMERFDSAQVYFCRVSDLSRLLRLPDDPVVAEFIGSCYKGMGNNQRAVDYFLKALEIYRNNGTENKRYNLVFSLAMIYAEWGWDEQAIGYYHKALKIQIAKNDSTGAAYTLANLAGIYGKSLGNKKGLEYSSLALKIFKKLNDPRGIGYVLNGIGLYYRAVGKPDSALTTFTEAIRYYQKIHFFEGMSFVYGNMGEIYLKERKLRTALSFFSRSFRLADSGKSDIARCTSLTSMGKVYQQTGQLNKAAVTFNQSLDIAVSRNYKEAMADNYHELFKLYRQLGQFNLAFEYISRYNDIRDSLFRENSQKVIAEMEARYATEKKERQIALLMKENELNKLSILSRERFTRLSVFSSVVLLCLLLLLSRFYFLRNRAYANYVKLTVEQLKKEQQMETDGAASPGELRHVTQKVPGAPSEEMTMNERLIEELKQVMAGEKLFLDPALTLSDVAQKLNTNTTYLSRAVNEVLHKNFSSYINELRIHKAQVMLTESEFANFSIEGIALSSGFNSKSAFNSSFKKYTGVTPSFFQKSALRQRG